MLKSYTSAYISRDGPDHKEVGSIEPCERYTYYHMIQLKNHYF